MTDRSVIGGQTHQELRLDDVEATYPGVLSSILAARPAPLICFGISRPTPSSASATTADATKTAWMAGSRTAGSQVLEVGYAADRAGTPPRR